MKIWAFLVLSLGFCVFAHSVEEPLPERICVSHTEGKGLGYSIGYTSLDLFISQSSLYQTLVTFIDLRGHVFNNGKYAANTGVGLRYLNECLEQVWGINAFYDYLETKRHTYNQVGVGLEISGKQWDAYANGYWPIGSKNTDIYRFFYDFDKPTKFDDSGVALPTFLLKAREQLAMKGFDTLIRYRCCLNDCFDVSVGAGPYCYWGTSAKTVNAFYPKRKNAYGGQLRTCLSFMDYVSLEGITTYDTRYKWTGQVTIALCVPLDFTLNQGKYCYRDYYESFYCLQERLYRSVNRNEIIVVDSINRFSTNPEVLDPENDPL